MTTKNETTINSGAIADAMLARSHAIFLEERSRMKTVKLDDGKYQFDIDEPTGMMMAARRNGEPWPAAFDEWRFNKCLMAALSRIIELEEAAAPRADDSICAVCDGGPGNSSACVCGLKRWESLPVARGALASSIAEVEALSSSEDRDLTISECESMMLVLHEMKRLQAVERQAVEIVAGATGPIPWRCFHCDETFTDTVKAQEHFGTSLHHEPACQIDIAKYRDMQSRVERSNAEDSDVHRQMYGMQARHATALRREEEAGYARGLKVNLGEDAMQRAAGDLPVGYDMRICLENGAGWIEIDDAEGNELTLETDNEGMTSRINEAIDIAIAHAAAREVKS